MMTRSKLVVVSEDQDFIQRARAFGVSSGAVVEVYSPYEQMKNYQGEGHGLTSGQSPVVPSGAKILPFPGSFQSNGSVQENSGKKVQTINELESVAIEKAIHEYGGNLTEAAKALGIGRATLYRKVKQYDIDTSLARKKQAA